MSEEEELLAVIAHELGHCMSGHVILDIVYIIDTFSIPILSSIPLGATLSAIRIALMEWYRKVNYPL
ncbi:MAG: M48 family metalloprotease [Ignavibacteria bacterium]|nr:M48 family metalloprotease [Ignavibacteria bacterium]